ncbi:MAG: hypothetical protein AB1777_04035 [Bacteroidota bacterium]
MITFKRFRILSLVFYTSITFLFIPSLNAFSQDSTWVWCEKGGKSLKFFGLIAYEEGRGEQGFGIPLGVGYQRQFLNGRMRLHTSIQAASFRTFAITDVPDSYYRVTTLGMYSDFDILRYFSFSIVLAAGAGLSYSRGYTSSWWDEYSGQTIYNGPFNRWYPTVYLAYGIRIAPRKSRYAIEIFLPSGGHANNNFYLLHAIRIGVDYRL